MRGCNILFLSVMLLSFPGCLGAQESFQSSSGQSVGLVLSGGGARGIAHIGTIQALEDNDIPIDYVAGTSAGAIVGGLYAAGYTPQEMLELFLSPGFADWSTGTVNPRLTYTFAKDEPTPALIKIPIPTSRHADTTRYSSLLPSSLISPLPMSFAFMQLFAPYTAQCGGNFDRLFVPYRCVASNSVKKRKQVMSHGDLGDAIRSSMSFPIVFQPISIDGDVMYDGGVYDNFPVGVMRSEFSPDIILGFDVSTNSPVYSNNVLDQLETLIMQGSDYNLPRQEGIKLHIDLNQYGLLDFPLARQIYKIGYDRTMDIIDSIKTRVTSRISKDARAQRRAAFKARTPYTRFASDSVTITGVGPQQARYIRDIFVPEKADTFGILHARDAYYRAITPGLIHTMQPTATYNPSTGLTSLRLDVKAKDNLSANVGGYVTSSTSSFIYLGARYKTMSYRSLNASIGGWLGQSYMAAQVDASLDLATSTPSRIGVRSVVSRQKYYESDNLFYEDKMPTFITGTEAYVQLLYTLACHRNGTFTFGPGYGGEWDRYYRSNREIFYEAGRDKTDYRLGQLRAEYRYNTLDNEMYPVSGHSFKATALGILGNYTSLPEKVDGYDQEDLALACEDNVKWAQLELRSRNYFPLGKHFVVGLEGDFMLSTRKLLPGYNASIVNAPAFYPTASSHNAFNPAFRANSFLAAGVVPVWRLTQAASIRGSFNAFVPLRKIMEGPDYRAYYGKWLHDAAFFGELAAVYTLPFASVSAYVNYQSYPARNWNCGLSLGLFFQTPQYLR